MPSSKLSQGLHGVWAEVLEGDRRDVKRILHSSGEPFDSHQEPIVVFHHRTVDQFAGLGVQIFLPDVVEIHGGGLHVLCAKVPISEECLVEKGEDYLVEIGFEFLAEQFLIAQSKKLT